MKLKMIRKCLSWCLTALAILQCSADREVQGQEPTPDVQIRAALDRAGLKYQIDKDGDFTLSIGLEADRTHLVWINSKTSRLGDLTIREIWAVGYIAPESTGRIPTPILQKMLEKSGETKMGAWGIEKMGDKHVALFTAKIIEPVEDDDLLYLLNAVATSADELELAFTGKDDL